MTLSVQEAWQRYYPPVREKCRRVLTEPQEADDVAQETFIKLWEAKLPGDASRVLAWLYLTATRACVDRLRARAMRASIDSTEDVAADLESSTYNRQLLSRVAATATADELEAAVLHRIDCLTQPEIARVLAVSERTVRRLISRFDERIAALKTEVS